MAAAVEAARALDFPFTLTARAENHIRDNPDLDDTIARLQAYERAGADVLYAPGLRDGEEIQTVCSSVSKPVNVLAHRRLTMSEIVDAGGQRVSLGGALAFTALGAAVAAAERIRDEGDFSGLGGGLPLGDWLALMPGYAAFLRGVNLGAKRKVSGAQLRECVETAGFEDVQPFRTSGNVLFTAGRQPRERLEAAIERALADALGFDVTVFVRTGAELAAIAEHQPFPAKAVRASAGKLQVSLLQRKPAAGVRRQVLALATD